MASPTPTRATAPLILSAFVVLAAVVVRVWAMNSPLWLDEVWSIRLAQKAGSPAGVFQLHHDNNHWLNTLVLYYLGPGRPSWAYHLFPLATGVGTIVLGWTLARRWGAWEAFAAAVLLGGSEWMVEFSTDARGYAPAGFFALLCCVLFVRYASTPARRSAAYFALSAVLGVLSHLTFLIVLGGSAASAAVTFSGRRGWVGAVRPVVLLFAAPVFVLALLYAVDLKDMIRGGGPLTPADLPTRAAAMYLGLGVGRLAAVVGVVAWVWCGVQVFCLYRGKDMTWPLYATVLAFVPAFLFLWPRDKFLHPRYLYVAVPFLLLLLARTLGGWLRGSARAKVVAAGVLTAFVVVNARPTATFIRLGRGDYRGAAAFILDHSAAPTVVVGSDHHPPSTYMVLDYYARGLRPGKRLAFMRGTRWDGQWPQWIVSDEATGPTLTTAGGVPFVRRAVFPDGAVASGVGWTVYEAESGGPRVTAGAVDLQPESRDAAPGGSQTGAGGR